MDQVQAFLSEWWPLAVLIAAVLFKVGNLLTPLWYEHAGAKRWMLRLLDLLDLVKNSKAPKLKGLVVLLAFAALAGGCGVTFKDALAGMHKGAKALSSTYEPGLQVKCMAAAAKCKGKGYTSVEQCTPYITCRDIQRGLAAGIATSHGGIAAVEKARRRAIAAGLLGEEE